MLELPSNKHNFEKQIPFQLLFFLDKVIKTFTPTMCMCSIKIFLKIQIKNAHNNMHKTAKKQTKRNLKMTTEQFYSD